VKQEGRTILFVSHSMDAIAGLCKSALVFNKGKVSEKLPVDEGIRLYLEQNSDNSDVPLAQKPRTQNRERAPIFTKLTMSHAGRVTNVIPVGGAMDFEVEVENFEEDPGSLTCGIAILNTRGQRIALFHSLYHSDLNLRAAKHRVLRCHVPGLPLTAGEYFIELVFADGFKELERVERAGSMRVVFADMLGTGKIPNAGQSIMVLPAAWSEAS
jgi:lipopolysaccharide transport system ATP-binding protein